MKEEFPIQEAERVFSATDAAEIFNSESSLEWMRKECHDTLQLILKEEEEATVTPLKHMIVSALKEHGCDIPKAQEDDFLWKLLIKDIAFPAIFDLAHGSDAETDRFLNIMAKTWGEKREDVKMRLKADYRVFHPAYAKSQLEKAPS